MTEDLKGSKWIDKEIMAMVVKAIALSAW